MDKFCDDEPDPSAPKRKKVHPQVTYYRSKLNSGWVKDFSFISPVVGTT